MVNTKSYAAPLVDPKHTCTTNGKLKLKVAEHQQTLKTGIMKEKIIPKPETQGVQKSVFMIPQYLLFWKMGPNNILFAKNIFQDKLFHYDQINMSVRSSS